jgi:NAD(P)-dependent dehydrogenase (short-subunit alcohol dehydrogenase family)
VLICNAGDTGLGDALATSPEDFAAQVRVNLLGAHHLTALVGAGMVERRRGDIVFVSTDAVRALRPGIAGYLTAKAGLEGLARAMQLELEGTGVRASIVRPGPTITGMGQGWDPAEFGRLMARWERFGVARHEGFMRPDHVAAAIVDVVSTRRGAHVTLLEIEPEAPIRGEDQA